MQLEPAQREAIPGLEVSEVFGEPPALDLDLLAKAAMRRVRSGITRSANKHLREMGLKRGGGKPLAL